MPVQKFAPMTKDYPTFDCDAHVTEPTVIWERAKDFLTNDELLALKAWPQNEGIPQANIDGTAKSLKDGGQLTTVPTFSQLVDLTLAKKIVKQLGAIKSFPY